MLPSLEESDRGKGVNGYKEVKFYYDEITVPNQRMAKS
jgi:hypothetical protein